MSPKKSDAKKNAADGKQKKLHIEVERDLLKKVEQYIDEYNNNPDRTTRRMKKVDVINLALERYLKAHVRGKEAGSNG